MNQADKYIADAVLGIDTLWGGDVMNPSGTGRFIADSWFSDFPLPVAYTHPAAAKLRAAGGVSKKNREALRALRVCGDGRETGSFSAAEEARTGDGAAGPRWVQFGKGGQFAGGR
jgi:hypothetical protein